MDRQKDFAKILQFLNLIYFLNYNTCTMLIGLCSQWYIIWIWIMEIIHRSCVSILTICNVVIYSSISKNTLITYIYTIVEEIIKKE